MPNVYTNSQVLADTMPSAQFTTSAGTKGVVVTNYSNYAMDVSTISGATHTTVPPYSIGKFQLGENQLWTIAPSTTLSVAAAIPNVSMYVAFQDSLTSVEPSIIPLAQLPAYQISVAGNVQLTGSSNTVNIGNNPSVSITGTPAVTLTGAGNNVNVANTPAVTLTGAGNNVNIGNTPAVTISGTPTVQLTASGNSVNIANVPAVTVNGTPSMNVANTSIPVTNYAGGSLNVAGQVNIGNTPSVSISGTPNVAISSGSVNATIQNASLNSNIVNALLQTGCTYVGTMAPPQWTIPAGGGNYASTSLQLSIYDEFTIVAYSANGLLNSYSFVLEQVRFNSGKGKDIWVAPPNSTLSPKSGLNSDSLAYIQEFTPVRMSSSTLANYLYVHCYNSSGSSITDTLTLWVGAKFSSNLVTNQSSQPVPISSNYYGTGADGSFNSTGNTVLSNTANAPAIYNYTSFTLNSGHTLQYANLAKYVIIYCTGDVTINGTLYAPSGMTNLGAPTTALSINGKTVPNAGNGGTGGNAASGGTGASGGLGNCYTAGAGGGGGGALGGPGTGGGTGYGNVAGGAGGSYQGASGGAGGSSPTGNTGTLCIVSGGTITINGTIYAGGATGGSGGGGTYNSTVNASLDGGGGSCGPNQGGYGGYQAGSGNYYGGGGAGGAGGGSVFLFAGGSAFVYGTINTNGGSGGGAGYGNTGSAQGGQAGTAGAITIWQLGGNGGGM